MQNQSNRMPVVFIGHGSPMNAIEKNTYTENWSRIAEQIGKPEAILSVSAHWYSIGTRISDATEPRIIYDMYGFPEELYRVRYPVKGAPELARLTQELIGSDVVVDNGWGIDHGTWSVLCRMYPEADIPVYQLSVDRNADPEAHYRIGEEIRALREKGVLILGSGNVVHNLSRVIMDMDGGYPWAAEFDHYIRDKVSKRQFQDVMQHEKAGSTAELAVPTRDHFYPLLYVLGASREDDRLTIWNDSCTMGSLSMTCYLFE